MIDSALYEELARQYLLYIHSADKKLYPAGSTIINEASGHQLVYIIAGHGTMRNPDNIFTMESGSICHFSSEKNGTLFFDIDSEVYIVNYDGSPALYYESFFPDKPWTIGNSFTDSLTFYFERLIKQYSFSRETLNAKNLTDLLTLLADISDKASKPTKKAPMQALNIREYVRQHYKEPLSLDNLSKVFHINKFQICRVFKEAFSLSVLQYQFELRMITASELLKSTNMTISEISCHLGFEDSSAMIRLFKKKYSCTPGSYRKSSRLAIF